MTDAFRIHPDGAPGQQELELRQQMGDVNYEKFRESTQRMNEAQIDQIVANADNTRANAALLTARGAFWTLLGLAVLVFSAAIMGLGLAWSIWWFVR